MELVHRLVICSGITGWWFQPCFMFHNIWDNPSHCLICFKMVKTTNQIMSFESFDVPTYMLHVWQLKAPRVPDPTGPGGSHRFEDLRLFFLFGVAWWPDLGWKNEEQSSSLSWFIIINQNISSYLAKINMEFCQILDMMIYSDDISTCKIISTYSIHSFCGVLWNLLTRDRAQGKPWTIPLGLGVRHGPSSSHLYSMTGVSSWKLG